MYRLEEGTWKMKHSWSVGLVSGTRGLLTKTSRSTEHIRKARSDVMDVEDLESPCSFSKGIVMVYIHKRDFFHKVYVARSSTGHKNES